MWAGHTVAVHTSTSLHCKDKTNSSSSSNHCSRHLCVGSSASFILFFHPFSPSSLLSLSYSLSFSLSPHYNRGSGVMNICVQCGVKISLIMPGALWVPVVRFGLVQSGFGRALKTSPAVQVLFFYVHTCLPLSLPPLSCPLPVTDV